MRRNLAIGLLLLAKAAMPAETASLRTATVEWERDSLAVRYELEVTRDGNAFARPLIDGKENRWSAQLEPGHYRYRLRSVDRLGRGGKWGEWIELKVLPRPPVVRGPRDGTRY